MLKPKNQSQGVQVFILDKLHIKKLVGFFGNLYAFWVSRKHRSLTET